MNHDGEKNEFVEVNKDVMALVEKEASSLLGELGLEVKTEFSLDEENNAVLVKLESESEKGLLIGTHGDNIRSLQSAIGMMVKNNHDLWVRVIVNVGDWKDRQEQYLVDLVEKTLSRLEATGQAQSLYNLRPDQRRFVHMYVAKKGYTSESSGEGLERMLTISK